MVNIKTLFFATCRDIVGEREVSMDIAEGATVSDLIEKVSSEHPAFRSMGPSLMVSVNQSYVDRTEQLNDGDEVAFIPPVSGG
jgi:molybdopterin converting factor subunit 1